MPGGDRTGPLGHGSMTGRGLGFCSGNNTPGYNIPRYGRGLRRGWNRGFGRGFLGYGRGIVYRNYQNISNLPQQNLEDEKTYLENMIKNLEEEIKSIGERIKEISKEKKEEKN